MENLKEAKARININKLLEQAGWQFFDDAQGAANIQLEPKIHIKPQDVDALGKNFEKTQKGFIDFLLLDAKGFPFIVLEAKSEDKHPLVGKEQARRYAHSLNCRFVILSNGNLHYFWDLQCGNPYIITAFPTPDSATSYARTSPNPQRLTDERVGDDYIVLTQRPHYASEAAWKNAAERPDYIRTNKLRLLRPYQKRAVHALQSAAQAGSDRFLFEMATGTGKTLVSAAVIKLFLRTGNARRVLFLVDRLELEEQARKAFNALLSNDWQTVIYKEHRDAWRHAEIVVTTVQSLLFNNKYLRLFSPTDFNLIISDEAHRSISGNARAVFEYFVGYKLGLTATPRDYLRHFDSTTPTTRDPREYERRLLLDTYRTFGCEDSQPTFRYSLLDAVREGHLINPITVDARTEITTQLLSDQGFVVQFTDKEGENRSESYTRKKFERRFFSDATNRTFCKTFLEHALRDPISNEIGKSIIFAVSQKHAARLTQIFNEMADQAFPAKYQSDFAVQVTSQIPEAQQFTINFANNNLCGTANFLAAYRSSKARVCITVGMMTTGYDCPDVLNVGLFRPIFSPTDFIQIKGRGTRKHDFREQLVDERHRDNVTSPEKKAFKLFDFFANCEYFEEQYNYDQVIRLPARSNTGAGGDQGITILSDTYEHPGPDSSARIQETPIGHEGMKIDRMFFDRFADTVRDDQTIAEAVEAGQWSRVIDYVNQKVFDKPEEYYTLDKLRKATDVDRRLTLREILEKIFGLIPRFKSKNELLEEEFDKFVADHKPDEIAAIPAIRHYFKAYVTNNQIRHIIENRDYTALTTNAAFSFHDFNAVPNRYRDIIPAYIKDYVSLNQFVV